MTQAQWKEASNKVEIIGYVNENNLELKEFADKQTGQPYKAMAGHLTIKTGENEVHRVDLFSKELTKDGNVSKQFTGYKTLMNELVSIADKGANPELTPSKVRVQGSLGVNDFVNQAGEMISNTQINGRFVNRIDADPTEPRATFDVEGVVVNVIDEFDRDGVETGRKKINILTPLYKPANAEVGKVAPLDFVVGEGEGADYVESEFEKGASVRLVGEIVNFREEKVIRTEMGFGEAAEETKVNYKREHLVRSGSKYEEGVHDAKIFDVELIMKSQAQRNIDLEKKIAEASNKPATPPTGGFGFGNGAATTSSSDNKPKIDVSNFF